VRCDRSLCRKICIHAHCHKTYFNDLLLYEMIDDLGVRSVEDDRHVRVDGKKTHAHSFMTYFILSVPPDLVHADFCTTSQAARQDVQLSNADGRLCTGLAAPSLWRLSAWPTRPGVHDLPTPRAPSDQLLPSLLAMMCSAPRLPGVLKLILTPD
jgi:hypothetical protein